MADETKPLKHIGLRARRVGNKTRPVPLTGESKARFNRMLTKEYETKVRAST